MPTDYMDLSRGVGQLGLAAQNIGQMVAQQRFRQAQMNQEMMWRQAQLAEEKRRNDLQNMLWQAQAQSERAQAGAYGAHQGLYQQQSEAGQYETEQRRALQTAIQAALAKQALTDEFNPVDEPTLPDFSRAAAIQATLPNAETPVNLMRNLAQAGAMQNPRVRDMIALGTRNPVMNVPAGATPLDLSTMMPGQQTAFRPFAPGGNDPRLKELATMGQIFGKVADAEEGDPNYGIYQQTTNRLGQLLSAPTGTNAPVSRATPAQKVKLANQLAQEHPDWSREQILDQVNSGSLSIQPQVDIPSIINNSLGVYTNNTPSFKSVVPSIPSLPDDMDKEFEQIRKQQAITPRFSITSFPLAQRLNRSNRLRLEGYINEANANNTPMSNSRIELIINEMLKEQYDATNIY